MLRNVNDLCGFTVEATDGRIGRVEDFYFDDRTWAIPLSRRPDRWLARGEKGAHRPDRDPQPGLGRTIAAGRSHARTGEEESRRRHPETRVATARSGAVRVSRLSVRPGGPGVWGEGKPAGLGLGANASFERPGVAGGEQAFVEEQATLRSQRGDDPHLRSCRAILRHHIEATDGEIGHVQGMLVDDQTWVVRNLVVKTSDWWLGHEVHIPSDAITNISWLEASVSVNLTRQAVKDAPA